MGNSGVVRDEPTVEVGKAKEGPYILDFSEDGPDSNAIEFDGVELTRLHDHPKVFYFWDIELAFLKLQIEVKLSHPLEDVVGSLCVGPWVGGGDKKVIHVDDKPSFSNHISDGVIHELLKCSGRVTKAKEHNH